jgi:hypothetical protein
MAGRNGHYHDFAYTTRKKLLTNILDPDREVLPNYLAYVVEAHGGGSYTGLTVNETAGSVTVVQKRGFNSIYRGKSVERVSHFFEATDFRYVHGCRYSMDPLKTS